MFFSCPVFPFFCILLFHIFSWLLWIWIGAVSSKLTLPKYYRSLKYSMWTNYVFDSEFGLTHLSSHNTTRMWAFSLPWYNTLTSELLLFSKLSWIKMNSGLVFPVPEEWSLGSAYRILYSQASKNSSALLPQPVNKPHDDLSQQYTCLLSTFFCTSFIFHFCDKTPDKSKLKKELFILIWNLRIQFRRQDRMEARVWGTTERWMQVSSSFLFLFLVQMIELSHVYLWCLIPF